jgi:hypothetical protein
MSINHVIVVAGATGNLGGRIARKLLAAGAEVRVLVRSSSNQEKVQELKQLGAKVLQIDLSDINAVKQACMGATCVVSALAGLREVIIDAQKVLLDGAVAAGVPRFIPSDFSLDFTKFNPGENRNLDWRREFHIYLDQQPIAATSVFNGAFADMLTNEMPLILFKQKKILYWGDADHQMAFTTVADTAAFTAKVALDESSPRYLRVAGDYISPRQIQGLMSEITGQSFGTIRPGGPGLLSTIIKIARTIAPGTKELYPAFQGMQYMRNMIDQRASLTSFDNNRYIDLKWTSVKALLTEYQASLT